MAKVSFVIRTKNEAPGMTAFLAALKTQTEQDYEIVLVDSGSTDGTVDIAREYGCRIIEIPPESFTFGYALNVGMEAVTSPLAIFISGHCLPADDVYIERLIAPFAKNPHLAAVYGRQIPFADASPWERRGLREAYPDGDAFIIRDEALFSNAHSAVRTDRWRDQKFDEKLTGAEDVHWAELMRKRGFTVGYEPRSVVHHSHQETLKQVRTRSWRETLALKAIKSNYTRPHGVIGYTARCIRASLYDYAFLCTHPTGFRYFITWFVFIIPYRIATYYGQYQGHR